MRIEEIVDDEKPVYENGVSKRSKKKKIRSNVSDDNVDSDRQLVVKSGHDVPVLESEDEDGFPVSTSGDKTHFSNSISKSEQIKDNNADAESQKKKPKTEASKNLKRKIDAVGRDGEHGRWEFVY